MARRTAWARFMPAAAHHASSLARSSGSSLVQNRAVSLSGLAIGAGRIRTDVSGPGNRRYRLSHGVLAFQTCPGAPECLDDRAMAPIYKVCPAASMRTTRNYLAFLVRATLYS